MVRIVFFFIFIISIMIFPVFVLVNQKVNIHQQKLEKNISLYTIFNGNFKKYDKILLQIGSFKRFDIYKNYYLATDLNLTNLLKKENFFMKNAKYKKPIIYADFLIYRNVNYFLKSKNAKYNSKTKIFTGNKFVLIGKNYNAKGESFLIDKNRNIEARDIIFDLKVNE